MHTILLHHSAVPAVLEARLSARWLAMLPPEKAARVARMASPSARAATLAGVALLQQCAAAAGLPAVAPGALHYPGEGKPAWLGGPDFSISHAAGHVACALAPPGIQVGLDIEPAGAADRAGLRLVAGEAELQAIATAGLTTTDLWTAKEAVAKLTGAGIAGVAAVCVGAGTASFRGREYRLARPVLAPGLHCAVAASAAAGVAVTEVPAERLLP
jgi:phosphopantetheinyl transferase